MAYDNDLYAVWLTIFKSTHMKKTMELSTLKTHFGDGFFFFAESKAVCRVYAGRCERSEATLLDTGVGKGANYEWEVC